MSRTPATVPEELVAALRAHFDDAALVELATAIAWENFRSRFNRVFDVAAQGFSAEGVCVLPAHASR
jgi:alkylhydroperoxidase family enzyme